MERSGPFMIHAESEIPSEPVKILFAGGCHVVGYPMGEAESFPAVVERRLSAIGLAPRIQSVGYLKLSHRRRLLEGLKGAVPDILVLQFGNPELNKSLSEYLLSRLHVRRKAAAGPDSGESNRLSDPESFVSSGSYLWNTGKALLDACLGHPLIDFDHIAGLWDRLLSELKTCPVRRTVLLSPFPCPDPLVMHYRRRGSACFREAANRWNCDFIDVVDAIPIGRREAFSRDYYRDVFHLGASGQEAVGDAVAIHLEAILRTVMTKECAR